MSRKPKVSARRTIVLTPEDLDDLDTLTMTGVIRDATDYVEKMKELDEAGDIGFEDDEFDILDSGPSKS